jgi:hypothetical protein
MGKKQVKTEKTETAAPAGQGQPVVCATSVHRVLPVLTLLGQSAAQVVKAVDAEAEEEAVARVLTNLVNEGLVKESQAEGAPVRWRLLRDDELEERARQDVLGGENFRTRVRLRLDLHHASALEGGLEFYARLCAGQWEEVCHQLRLQGGAADQLLGGRSGGLSQLLEQLKGSLLGLAPNASWGVAPDSGTPGQLAWEVYTLVRHRRAWDFSPQGGIGVTFDEPLGSKKYAACARSWRPPQGRGPFATHVTTFAPQEYRMCVDIDRPLAAVLERALTMARRVMAGEVTALVELVRSGQAFREAAPSEEALSRAQVELAQWEQKLVAAQRARLQDPLDARLYMLAQTLRAHERCEREGTYNHPHGIDGCFVGRQEDIPHEGTYADLPGRHWLGYSRGRWKVVAARPGEEELGVLGESHSLQTALYMAVNVLSGSRPRSWS